MKPQQLIEILKSKGIEAYVDAGGFNRKFARHRIRSEFDVDINGNGAVIASGATWDDVANDLKQQGLI